MADTKISQLPAAAALTGTEPIPAVQSSATVQTTPNAIAALATANGAASSSALTAHTSNVSNPHSTTAAQVAALAIANNLSDVANTATARTNLALGTAATQATTAFGRTIVFYAPGVAAAWTSMPLALTEFRGQTATRLKSDLTVCTQFRIMVRVTGTAGVAAAVVGVQYSTDEVTWNWLDGAGSPPAGVNAVSVSTLNTTAVSAWTSLASGAKGDVVLRVAGQGGDGATSPTFGVIALEVR